jgi:peptide deformylase
MAVLEIFEYPADVLKQVAQEVSLDDPTLPKLISDMFDTMRAAPGIGLAAPQVGVSKRLIVVDVTNHVPEVPPFALINPEILSREGTVAIEEGCLSVPDLQVEVERAETIVVSAINGQTLEKTKIRAEGLAAIVIQHEIDHLNGTLIIDKVSRLKRGMYLQQRKKMRKKALEQTGGRRMPSPL